MPSPISSTAPPVSSARTSFKPSVPTDTAPGFLRTRPQEKAVDGNPGVWARQHVLAPVRHAAHGVRTFGHNVRQMTQTFGHRLHGGTSNPAQVHPSGPAPTPSNYFPGIPLQPMPNLRPGDEPVRHAPPRIEIQGYSKVSPLSNHMVTRELPDFYGTGPTHEIHGRGWQIAPGIWKYHPLISPAPDIPVASPTPVATPQSESRVTYF